MGRSLVGREKGLGETGIGECAEPNTDLSVGTGSGVVGDGGTLGLECGEGHEVAGVVGSMNSPSLDSSYGSTTVGSGDCEPGLHS